MDEERDTRDFQDHDEFGEIEETTDSVEVSYEELEARIEQARREAESDIDLVDTAHTDGSTENPLLAMEQGLVYTPPSDPPVLPGGEQNVEIAAGFASSMEEIAPGELDLPDSVEDNDLDLAEQVRIMLRNNSETAHLAHVGVAVRDAVVYLVGLVDTEDDIAIVDEMIRDMEPVEDVRNHLRAKDR